MNRAIIVSQPSESTDLIEQTVKNSGFGTLIVSAGNEARQIIKSDSYLDLIIINTPLSDEFGHELAETASYETSADVILICTGDIAAELENRLSEFGITVLIKPVSRDMIIRNINQRHFPEIRECSEIMNRIDNMRLINRAKSILMKYLKFTEPQAHRYIEKQAMNNRCTRRESAEKIIKTYEK
ncbi:MAG: ANTAR domain-containing protein [Ruminococcus sp.]|nr:ANTAR domain-containing protein [Ruminococcus sp.]